MSDNLYANEYGCNVTNEGDCVTHGSTAEVCEVRAKQLVAEALREAAEDFQLNTWADVVTPAMKTDGIKSLAVAQAFIDWLRTRADRIESER